MFVGSADDQGEGVLRESEFVQIVGRHVHARCDEGEFDVALTEEGGKVGIRPLNDMEREVASIILKEAHGAGQQADQRPGRAADAQGAGDALA